MLRPMVQHLESAPTGRIRPSHIVAACRWADWQCCWWWQGGVGGDVDLPTYLEANYIATFVIKVVWVCCYILVYGIRPVVIRPKKVGEPLQQHFHCLGLLPGEQCRRQPTG